MKQVGEQVMVAKPLALVVQRNNEDIRPVEALKDSLSILAIRYGLAQPCVQTLQKGGMQQERLHVLGLALKDLLDQIICDINVAAGKASDESGNVAMPLH